MKNKTTLLLFIFFSIGLFYLFLPSPKIPALPDSYKSDEPGDTGQIPNVVAAYYTNASREKVIKFYRESFKNSPFYNIPLITYKFNHPPEYSREIIIDTMQSSFFEELVHPLRESLFINGYYIEIVDKDKGIVQSYAVRDGKKYKNKITLYYIGSQKTARVFIFSIIIIAMYTIFRVFTSIMKSPWRSHKTYQS